VILISAFLCVALARPAPTVLDQRFLPTHGLVTLAAEGSRLDVRTDQDGSRTDRSFDISALAPDGRILEARCGAWLDHEMVIVLAVQQGETTSYRYALSAFEGTRGGFEDENLLRHFVDRDQKLFLANPVFTSTGEPFRIVAVNDHTHGSDALEITFRRGWIKRAEDAAKIEEKILFDSCGGFAVEPLQFGRAVLLERGGTPR